MKIKTVIFFLLIAIGDLTGVIAQSTGLALEVVRLINQSRSNPSKFLNDHRPEIENFNPKYISVLENAKPINPVIMDEALTEMCRKAVENKDQNPDYKGKNEICGFSGGYAGGDISTDPLHYVCDAYTNVNDQDYKYFGIYFNAGKSGYSFRWGVTCERDNIEYIFNSKIDSSKVLFDKINTGRNEKYLSTSEKRMILEINLVRAYPKIYAQIIQQYLSDKSSAKELTKDTYDAGIELIAELEKSEPLSILTPMQCIYLAAEKHGEDCKLRGFTGHTGSDGSQPWDRILRTCTSLSHGNENLTGGGEISPRIPVIRLLLDDGISTRGHRYNMLDKEWKFVGCYVYQERNAKYGFGYYWVQNFGR